MSERKVSVVKHGNYVYGKLDGVDFVASGILQETGQKYDASIKLKFITNSEIIRVVNNIEIPTIRAVSQIIKMKCKDEELSSLAQKYNALLGKELLIQYEVKDGNTFVSQNESKIIEV